MCYSARTVKRPPLTPETSVLQALETTRGVARVFIQHRTACVGCMLARFCTLRDVAQAYGLTIESFVDELNKAALADPTYLTGENHEKSE